MVRTVILLISTSIVSSCKFKYVQKAYLFVLARIHLLPEIAEIYQNFRNAPKYLGIKSGMFLKDFHTSSLADTIFFRCTSRNGTKLKTFLLPPYHSKIKEKPFDKVEQLLTQSLLLSSKISHRDSVINGKKLLHKLSG